MNGGIRSSGWAICIAALLTMAACTDAAAPADPTTLTVRILHTSDIHGKLTGYNYFSARDDGQPSLVHAAAVIAKARAQQANTILIDNGDLIQGDPLADWAMSAADENGHAIIMALNSLRYDVANLGNHEFNFGLDNLYLAYQQAQFPLLSSNIAFTDSAPLALRERVQPWVMLQRDFVDSAGQSRLVKIAVIGVVPPQIMQWDAKLLIDRVIASDMVSATAKGIAEARAANADVIIIAAHSGLPRPTHGANNTEQVVDKLAQLEHVDAIIFGHQHQVFPGAGSYTHISAADDQRGTIYGVPAVSPGYGGSHVGQIDLTLEAVNDGWKVVDFSVQALASDAKQLDTQLLQQLQQAHNATQQYVQQPVGVTQQPLSYATARLAPSSGVQFVQRAQLWYAQQRMQLPAQYADLPLLSAAAPFDAAADSNEAYTEISAGQVSLGQIADLYRYPNSLDVVKLSGQQLKDWLEASANAFVSSENPKQPWSWVNGSVPHYNFDHVMGVSYRIDPRQPIGQRITHLHVKEQAVSADQQFLVLVNSYRSSGGGGFPHLDGSTIVLQSPDQLPDILRWYLSSFDAAGYPHEIIEHWSLCPDDNC